MAKPLKALVGREQPGPVLLGEQAIDDDCNQTGQMLAALARLPQATFASKDQTGGRQDPRHARGRRRPGDPSRLARYAPVVEAERSDLQFKRG